MYRQDSFFDLSPWGQIGLASLSLVLFVATLGFGYIALRKLPLLMRILGASLLFWLFVWLSPQVYYTYYRMIIPDLPLQWVIWPPPGPDKAWQLLAFQWRSTLSAHGQGLLGWSLLILSVFAGRRR